MPNVPDDLDPFEMIQDEEQLYLYNLFTNDVDLEGILSPASFTKPTDEQYAAQEAYAVPKVTEDEVAVADLAAVMFKGEMFAVPITVRGFFVTAKFDDGEIYCGFRKFPNPVLVGVGLPDLQCVGRLISQKLPADMPFVE